MLDLEAIKAREALATEGPWEVEMVEDSCETRLHLSLIAPPWSDGLTGHDMIAMMDGYGDDMSIKKRISNLEFIAAARADVPALIAEVEQTRAALVELFDEVKHNEDAGPRGDGFQSPKFQEALNRARAALGIPEYPVYERRY